MSTMLTTCHMLHSGACSSDQELSHHAACTIDWQHRFDMTSGSTGTGWGCSEDSGGWEFPS